MGTRNNTWALWQPDETIEAIADVLSSRWSAARSQPAGGLFWERPTSWLREQAQRLGLTTAPAAAGSSDKPQDRHRY